MTGSHEKLTTVPTNEAEVENYLREHPKFFDRHPDLLCELILPHPSGNAVSLIERQVQLLREKNHKLERKLRELVQVGRDNERLANRMQSLALGLLEADSLDAVLAITGELLRHEFDAERVVIRLIDHHCDARTQRFPERFISKNAPELALFNDFFASKRPICGRLSPEQLDFLFGAHRDTVASAALVPLTAGRELGLLGLSSCSSRRFQPHMGLLFLSHLGELVSNALKPHL